MSGDEFLSEVSAVLQIGAQRTMSVARIGGDEFAVLVREFSEQDELRYDRAARRIGCVVPAPTEQMGMGMVRASIGIASYPDLVDDYRCFRGWPPTKPAYRVKRSVQEGLRAVRIGAASSEATLRIFFLPPLKLHITRFAPSPRHPH